VKLSAVKNVILVTVQEIVTVKEFETIASTVG
jgi:hypothetical protein